MQLERPLERRPRLLLIPERHMRLPQPRPRRPARRKLLRRELPRLARDPSIPEPEVQEHQTLDPLRPEDERLRILLAHFAPIRQRRVDPLRLDPPHEPLLARIVARALAP